MKIYASMKGYVHAEITSADIHGILDLLTSQGVEIYQIKLMDELNVRVRVSRQDFQKLQIQCQKRGDALRVVKHQGIYWAGKGLFRRPVLLAGIILLLLSALWIPKRVFFVRVEGNGTIPVRKILEEAAGCGIDFGSSRRSVRSEKAKNALLEAIPELQWAGVNTQGCVAVIQVKQRVHTATEEDKSPFGHIVALRDGVITECTATRGSLLCAPGQAVTEGEILISGYTDCGLLIRAEQAEGEIYALTRREIHAATLTEMRDRLSKGATGKKISILFGKKRINLWKDSGISDGTCDRMYEEYYITLPGGFQLPMAVIVERYTRWETSAQTLSESEVQLLLADFGASYLQQQMLAGKILNGTQRFINDEGRITMAGQYICMEMIGKMCRLQIGEHNGKNN